MGSETFRNLLTLCLSQLVTVSCLCCHLTHRRIGIMSAILAAHQHGKGRVRLGRVWREGTTHHMVEWTVFTMLESDMAHAFKDGSNTDMTATDTQKNTVAMRSGIDPRQVVCDCQLTRGPRCAPAGVLYRQKMLAALYA